MQTDGSRLNHFVIALILIIGLIACDRGYQGNDNPTNPTPETTTER